MAGTVEEDEVAERAKSLSLSLRLLVSLLRPLGDLLCLAGSLRVDGFRKGGDSLRSGRPVGVIRLMVPQEEEDGAELAQLGFQEVEEPVILNVADVSQERQVGGLRRQLEDIVGGGRFEMEI